MKRNFRQKIPPVYDVSFLRSLLLAVDSLQREVEQLKKTVANLSKGK